MKIGWVIYGAILTEQHSIMNLSAVLKQKGFESVLIYEKSHNKIFKRILEEGPDILCYSLMFGSHWKYKQLCETIRDRFPGIYQIMGGPLPTFYPEILEEFSLDAICIGEGEISLVTLIENFTDPIKRDETKGFIFKSKNGPILKKKLIELAVNLGEFDFPDRKILYEHDALLRDQEFKTFLSGRGCPYKCNYCFNHKFNEMFRGLGPIVRKKPVDYFIEELLQVKTDYGFQYAIFEDDIFVLDKEWLFDFVVKYRQKIGSPFICYVRPNLVSEDICKQLRKAGCFMVRMAIESGSERIRKKILNRNISDETILQAADHLHSNGIRISVSNMIGLPTETIADVEKTLDLNIKARVDNPTAQFFMPYPRMDLSRIAVETGHFREDLLADIHKNTWKKTPLVFSPNVKSYMGKTQKLFALFVRFPGLRRYKNLLFKIPDGPLYLISLGVRIWITKKLLPAIKVDLKYRIRFLARFFSFYG